MEDRHKSKQSMTWEQYDNQALSFADGRGSSLCPGCAALAQLVGCYCHRYRWRHSSSARHGRIRLDGSCAPLQTRAFESGARPTSCWRLRRRYCRVEVGRLVVDGEQCMRWLDMAGVRRLAPRAVAAMELLAQPAPPPVLGMVANDGDTRLNGEKLLELGCGDMVLRYSASAQVHHCTNSLQRTSRQRVGGDSEGAGAMLPSVIDSSSFDADSSRVLFEEYGVRGSVVRQRVQFHLRVLKILSLWNAHYVARLLYACHRRARRGLVAAVVTIKTAAWERAISVVVAATATTPSAPLAKNTSAACAARCSGAACPHEKRQNYCASSSC